MSNIRFDNNEVIDEKYLSLPQVEAQRVTRALFPTRGQEAIDQTLAAIQRVPEGTLTAQNKNTTVLEALKKAPKEFLSNPDYMLDAIKKNHNAFEYASKELKQSNEFLAKAIRANPAVYSHLTLEQKINPQFHQEYEKRMLRDVLAVDIGNNNSINLPRHAMDKDFPYSMEKYRIALEANTNTVLDDPTSNAIRTPVRTYMAVVQAAGTQNQSLQDKIQQTENDYYTSPDTQEKALTLATTQSRIHAGADAFLQKMEEMNPELTQEIARRQEQYWLRTPPKKTDAELQAMTPKERQQEAAKRLREETPLVQYAKAKAHVEYRERHPRADKDFEIEDKEQKIIKEAEKRVKEQKMREECLDYMKNSCKDYIYSLVSDGRISQGDADLCIGLIESIPSITKASYTHTNIAQASINDFDNGDFHMTPAEIDDLKQAIVVTDTQLKDTEEKIRRAEQEATQRIDDSYLLRAHPRVHEERWHKHSVFG